MKKLLLKIAVLTLVVLMSVMALTSCDILFALLLGNGCTHTDITPGNCIERTKCNICGETVDDFGDHEYANVFHEPTCTEDGVTVLRCKLCGHAETGATVPAIGHSFGEWEVTLHPTLTEWGKQERECERCGFVEWANIEAHEHDIAYAEAREVDCESDGWEAHEYCTICEYNNKVIIKATGHDYGDYISDGNGTHSATCRNSPAHVSTEPCSGGELNAEGLPICDTCGSEYELAVRPGNSTYGYYALGTYSSGKGMQSLYRDLTTASELFYESDNEVIPELGRYIIGKFNVKDYGISIDEAMAVWKIFYVSSPAYYWLDASVISVGNTVLLTVDPGYATSDYRDYCDDSIDDMVFECSKLLYDGMSDLERAAAIAAYIVTGMEYAYEADGETPVSDMWAHSMTGLAVHGYGVCEAYAKSFVYLCLLNGIDCIAGSGYAGTEAHAWNYVKLGDEWYGVDLTWTDNSGDVAVYDYFGLSADSIYADHTSHPSIALGVEFIYEAPELADEDLELTALYKNGEYVGLYGDMDEAFASATDYAAEYTVDVGYYSSYASAKTHSLESMITPAVKKLTIRGNNEYVGEGYLDNNSVIYIPHSLTLGSNLELENVELKHKDSSVYCVIKLSIYSLTLSGESVYIGCRVEGNAHTSALVVATARDTYINGGVDIYRLTVNSGRIIFGSDSLIDYSNTKSLYVTGGAKVTVSHYEYK